MRRWLNALSGVCLISSIFLSLYEFSFVKWNDSFKRNNGTADYDCRIEEFKVNTNLKHNCAAIPKVTELFHCFRLASILGKDDYQSCYVRIWYTLNQGTPWPRTSRLARFLFFSYVKKKKARNRSRRRHWSTSEVSTKTSLFTNQQALFRHQSLLGSCWQTRSPVTHSLGARLSGWGRRLRNIRASAKTKRRLLLLLPLLPTFQIYLITRPRRWFKGCCGATCWHAVTPTPLSDESFVRYYHSINFQRKDRLPPQLASGFVLDSLKGDADATRETRVSVRRPAPHCGSIMTCFVSNRMDNGRLTSRGPSAFGEEIGVWKPLTGINGVNQAEDQQEIVRLEITNEYAPGLRDTSGAKAPAKKTNCSWCY